MQIVQRLLFYNKTHQFSIERDNINKNTRWKIINSTLMNARMPPPIVEKCLLIKEDINVLSDYFCKLKDRNAKGLKYGRTDPGKVGILIQLLLIKIKNPSNYMDKWSGDFNFNSSDGGVDFLSDENNGNIQLKSSGSKCWSDFSGNDGFRIDSVKENGKVALINLANKIKNSDSTKNNLNWVGCAALDANDLLALNRIINGLQKEDISIKLGMGYLKNGRDGVIDFACQIESEKIKCQIHSGNMIGYMPHHFFSEKEPHVICNNLISELEKLDSVAPKTHKESTSVLLSTKNDAVSSHIVNLNSDEDFKKRLNDFLSLSEDVENSAAPKEVKSALQEEIMNRFKKSA